jgi:ubiquinone/menaquinone biosynthesis C-methylase UbiE
LPEAISCPGSDLQAWNLNVYKAAWAALTNACSISAASRILEIGCGQGIGLAYLAQHNAGTFTGVDQSHAATLIARRTGLTIIRAERQALPMADASFDAVVMIEALFVFAGWEAALPEVRRVLTPGDHLVTAEFTSMTIEEARIAVARHAETAGFRLITLDDHSADARRAIIEGEAARARFLRYLPALIATCFRDVLALKGSARYAKWAERRQAYYLAVLQAI